MRSTSRPPQPRHLLAALACCGLVLGLHGWLLTGWPPAAAPGRGAAPPRSLEVRQIVLLPPTAPVATPPAQGVAPVASGGPPRAPAPRPQRAAAAAAPPATTPVGEPAGEAAESPVDAAPVYATRLPPPATLHYSLQRGAARGEAVLRWAADGGTYTLLLQGHLPAAPNVAWHSQGAIDAHGIAPDRYTESRRGRELRAVNFQRDSARITFSGPQHAYGLPPGAQDRLSWMLQLGAVLAADGELATAGRQVLLFVAGSRGDAEVWTFVAMGRETIELADGSRVDTVALRRAPRRTYDTLAEVWLDPARHHLPVRARLTLRGDSTQFDLAQLTLP